MLRPEGQDRGAPPTSTGDYERKDALLNAEIPVAERRLGGRRRAWSPVERVLRRISVPGVGALVAFSVTGIEGPSRLGPALLVGAVVWLSYRLTQPYANDATFLPLMAAVWPAVAPALAFAMLVFLKGVSVVEGMTVGNLLLVAAAITCASFLGALSKHLRRTHRADLRVGVVGSARTASDLALELRAARTAGFSVVGYIPPPAAEGQPEHGVPLIGRPGELAAMVQRHRLDLLLVSPEMPRLSFFDEVASTCLHLPVRVRELAAFYEECIGHVPLAAINSAWFQWVVHPRFTPSTPTVKRGLDFAIGALATLISAPILVVAAVLIKLDGGPLLYRQERIGEGGRPFEMLKLRTMRPAPPDAGHEWSSATDDRVTTVGRFLRRTHLDEMPQFVNVLRGEMSIVGPRPEQPGFVQRLEQNIAFYTRRHIVRPGITGWAQVQCGYAGSDAGSALKVCHDLYYLKHRSLALDLLILGETMRTLFADRQWDEDQERPRVFVHVDLPETALDPGATVAATVISADVARP